MGGEAMREFLRGMWYGILGAVGALLAIYAAGVCALMQKVKPL
jgi:cell division protein FtsX